MKQGLSLPSFQNLGKTRGAAMAKGEDELWGKRQLFQTQEAGVSQGNAHRSLAAGWTRLWGR